ncbi:MAG: hypothetical protein M1826_007678 [Phylliscum demangeonii]|nr:MAG: hypothetical protein M1826_007678 [Phylliscum demangeonii]
MAGVGKLSAAVLALALALSIGITTTCAQQLSGSQMFIGYPGLSPSCQHALNTTVSCPPFLSPLSANNAILNTDQVNALCVPSCHDSLQSARTTIQGACTAATDVIVHGNVAYPATFLVDIFRFTYDLSCRKDSRTGLFCDPQLRAWSTQNGLTSAQICSDCWLGGRAIQLSNPLGYDANLASNLAFLTSSCSATGYAFTSPTAYALNATATTVPATAIATHPPTCTGAYTVQATDDCNSAAKALGVSTYNLLYDNNLDLYCLNFAAAVGTTLCVPAPCTTYTWQASDSCASLVSTFPGMTIPQFLSWNPNFNSLCQNSLNYVGYQVCVSPPGGYLDSGTRSNVSTATAATAAVPAPTNAMLGSNRKCGNWYTIIAGDTCGLVSLATLISLSDFYFLNPEINAQCTNLDLGVAYCVKAVGDITTYANYTMTAGPTITVPPASFSSVNTAIPTSSGDPGFVATTSLLPKASGTIQGCDTYRNYDGQNGLNGCSYIAYAYEVTTDQLLAWNSGLSSNLSACNFLSGYSYCVRQSPAIVTVPTAGACLSVDATEPGTAVTCNCYTQIHGYQNTTGYNCASIARDAAITLAQLTTWNPWLGSNCDTALYAHLGYQDRRAICIGVNASAPTGTASAPPSTALSRTGTQTTASMGPTQTGVVAGCLQVYTVRSGDSCNSIETAYGITFAQFYSWNPSVGSQCANLWLGYAYCVRGPASGTTSVSSTATGAGPTSPTQTGITSRCVKFYTVVAGDQCATIQTQFGITFAQLYQWNPAIGAQCQSLWVGYAVCVASS